MACHVEPHASNLVLVVEDETTTRKLLHSTLVKQNYQVISVATAEQGFDCLRENDEIAILVTDWQLPGMSGSQLITKLRNEFPQRYIYSILVTGQFQKMEIGDFLEIGVDDFLVKPIDHVSLLSRLGVAARITTLQLDLAQKRRELEAQHQNLIQIHREKTCLLESIPQFLVTCNSKDIVTSWNHLSEVIFGIPREKVVGKNFLTLKFSWDWSPVLLAMASAIDGRSSQHVLEHPFTHPNGTLFYLDLIFSAIFDELDNSIGTLIIGSDVTSRRRMLEDLESARKLELIGQLSSGISHEINTPMQFIGDNLRWSLDCSRRLALSMGKLKNGETTQSNSGKHLEPFGEDELDRVLKELPCALDEAIEGVNRVTAIIGAMRNFSHPSSKNAIKTNINEIIQSTILICRNEWKDVCNIETVFDPACEEISCFPGELGQVILNLIVNSSHAIREKLGPTCMEKGTVSISTKLDLPWFIIEIADDGIGIPEEIKSRVFEPFFTTKEVGKGTGQGLNMCHNVISNLHKGKISFTSSKGSGACFTIKIPGTPDLSSQASFPPNMQPHSG